MMDYPPSPLSTPEVRLAVAAAEAVKYLEEVFYRRLSELAKSRPGNFFLDDSRYYH
jgi:hypothetical protein